ncbi:MAG TPA: RNB domain-containing ribonuclease, partial [Thermoanaerobaculia bacterium]|nr:RNB domain-containing ribonuclease [Thermoanaerobaculia bacterium]
DRLAMVVEMEVLEDGTVAASDVYRALVHNHAKLVYEQVAAWLDGDGPLPERAAAVPRLSDLLRLQDATARGLRRRRHERGALRLDRPEVTAEVVDGCTVTGFREDRQNRARELIEDFMIAANETTARFLESRGVPSLRRVVRAPGRWPRIVDLARQLGEDLPPEPDSPALAAFLDGQREADPAGFPELSLAVTKLMGSGEYAVDRPGEESPGHFGLAVEDYTHATAPNRRYPDLITQRQLKAVLDGGRSVYTEEELEELARHCTLREDEAAKVERQITKSAAALLLQPRLGEEFEAVVTGASEKGTWVRLCGFPAEGRLVRGTRGADVGDRFRVRLTEVDVERGYIDFER